MLCITVRKGKLYRMHISIYNTPQILRVLASNNIISNVYPLKHDDPPLNNSIKVHKL